MEAENRKNALFETMDPLRALAVMALPTVASQMIILLYNLADTWFIGRTNDPCMNAVDKGKVSFLLALVRHIALIIPVMLVMDRLWGITGLIWSQLIADLLNAVIACLVFRRVDRGIA